MLLLVPALAVLCSTALWLVLGRPRFLKEVGAKGEPARVSVIIPARNEAGVIGQLLESIAAQEGPPHEVLVVDDGSTDATAEVARAHGARVVNPGPLPEGWKGKPWACHEGARVATGDWFLFLDADTRMEPGALTKLRARTGDPARVSSVCPYHAVESRPEGLSAFFNVIMLAGVNAFGIQSDPSAQAALFGQCLLISRECYAQVDGHEKVRGEILENFHLAGHLQSLGIARDCFVGKGSLAMRMFPGGFRELWASWKKGFTTGAKQAAPRALVLVSIWITGAMLALCGVVLTATPVATEAFRAAGIAVYLLYAMQCWWAFRMAGAFSFLNALFFPVSLLFYQVLFFTSLLERAFGVKTQWKGRHVD